MKLPYGKYKGREVREVAGIIEADGKTGASYLTWLRDSLDENDPKFGANNIKLKQEITESLECTTWEEEAQAQVLPEIPQDGTLEAMNSVLDEINALVAKLRTMIK